jgi:ABC-type Fe3+/spermidine/putrescine transport system ATPase subunit
MHTTTTASPSTDAEQAPAPLLELTEVSVDFGATRVLHDLDLTVDHGEFIALLGPSGSGKTTTIRAIAGFTPPSSGSIRLDGKELSGTPIHKRNIGIVFQT